MTIVYLLWLWFFSQLFIDVDSRDLLVIGLIATLITADLYRFCKWATARSYENEN